MSGQDCVERSRARSTPGRCRWSAGVEAQAGCWLVLALLVSGCAAGRAFRKGRKRRAPATGTPRSRITPRAVQAEPRQRGVQDRARARDAERGARSHQRARELETKDQLDGALIEYRRALELDRTRTGSPRRGSVELERTIRDRIEATRPQAADRRRCASRRAAQGSAAAQPADRRLPRRQLHQREPARHPQLHRHRDRHQRHVRSASITDKAYTVRLEGVTLEQALQQICRPTSCSTRSSTRRRSSSSRTTPQKHAQYDELVVRVFYISHADAPELAQVDQHGHAHPDDAGAADDAAEQDRQHDHRARDRRRSWR